MKKYKYSAINLERKKYNGVYFANSEEHLRSLLAEQGLFLVSCKAIADKSPNPFFSLTGKISTIGRISPKETFFQTKTDNQLAILSLIRPT